MTQPIDHGAIVRHIAGARFPFPNQQDWPADYHTVVNAGNPTTPIDTPAGPAYPDIVIVNDDREVREMGEIETEVTPDLVEKWRGYSAALPVDAAIGVRPFFVYVPDGQEETARAMLEANGISFAGVRAYRVENDGRIRIIPYVTPGAAKDHRE